jgi:hypothetical protein
MRHDRSLASPLHPSEIIELQLCLEQTSTLYLEMARPPSSGGVQLILTEHLSIISVVNEVILSGTDDNLTNSSGDSLPS